ncbi:MAG: adenosylcobinamide-GDP ribazoletransferase [Pseudomonadota bacterium]
MSRPGPLGRLAGEGRALLSALQFATRLPLPDPGWEPGRMTLAAAWLPLAGAFTGAFAGAIYILAAEALPPLPAAVVAIGALVWLTGTLHEDGLADLADATGAYTDRARALEILRDSRLGSYGVAALVIVILGRIAALAALLPMTGALALVLAGALGRSALLIIAATLPPARPDGLGASLLSADGVEEIAARFRPRAALAAATAVLVAVGVAGIAGVAAIVAAVAAMLAVAGVAQRRLGGATGDVYGAAAAAAEAAAMLAFAGIWGAGV